MKTPARRCHIFSFDFSARSSNADSHVDRGTELNSYLYFSFPYNPIRFSCWAISRPDKTRISRCSLLVLEGRLSLLGKGGHALLLVGRSEQLLEETSFETKSFA